MKLYKRYIDGYSYKKKNLKNGICLMCGYKGIVESICPDCLTEDILIYYKERSINKHKHTIDLEFELSSKQKKASKFFLNSYKKRKDAFLYAVCGSGKTEIMYESILYALNSGDKVLIAIPRKEIVKELSLRLKNVFINTTITILDESHHDDEADLIISTVNQLINYDKEFDLIILDEADAYPYSESPFLKRLLKKSLKDNGAIFYMSATIKDDMPLNRFILNRRYHNNDLSMPIFIKENDILKNAIFRTILSNNRKHIIYVSSINKAKELSNKLLCPHVSSKTKNIDQILNDFRLDKYKYIVSTTILERGITIKNVDVIIYDSDSNIFDKNTIIQICGRVGRKIDDNKGNIYIFYRHNHLKFYLVKSYIRRMNEM